MEWHQELRPSQQLSMLSKLSCEERAEQEPDQGWAWLPRVRSLELLNHVAHLYDTDRCVVSTHGTCCPLNRCPVCFEQMQFPFTGEDRDHPHAICMDCMKAMQENKQFECPMCRHARFIPRPRVRREPPAPAPAPPPAPNTLYTLEYIAHGDRASLVEAYGGDERNVLYIAEELWKQNRLFLLGEMVENILNEQELTRFFRLVAPRVEDYNNPIYPLLRSIVFALARDYPDSLENMRSNLTLDAATDLVMEEPA